MKTDRPKVPTIIHGPSGPTFLPLEKKNNATVDCLENQFKPHDVCEENHERRVEAGVRALFEAVETDPEKVGPCNVQKLINSLKLRKACGNDDVTNECLTYLPRRPPI
jgi:hypothetical protein